MQYLKKSLFMNEFEKKELFQDFEICERVLEKEIDELEP
jgi:hypothetical protein